MTHFGGVKSASLPHSEQLLAGISEQGSWALVHASQEIRRDADFFLRAVAKDGACLMHAAEELCADEKVVLAAVAQDGHALRYAASNLRSDPDFALECVKCSSESILYIAPELRQDPHFTLQAALNGCSRDLLNPRLRVWLERRDELLARFRETIDNQDLLGIREVIKDAEKHGLPDRDFQEPRMAVKKLMKYSEVGSLWEPLKKIGEGEAPVVLLRGTWLCKLAAANGRLPKRQDLPAEAIWDVEDLQRDSEEYDQGRHLSPTKVVAISYCWHRAEHPDPHGTHLQAISALVSSCLADLSTVGEVDLAIFLDYCSLFQEPRSIAEAKAFEESLKNVAIWYAHKRTQVWILTSTPETCDLPEDLCIGTSGATSTVPVLPYESRGWPSFERNVAELLACEGGAGQSILLVNDFALRELINTQLKWSTILERFKTKQEPPKVPSDFCELLATKTFSQPRDLEMLQDAYTIVFEETMHTMRTLVYCDLGWGDRAAAELSWTVKACFLLVNIEMEGNSVADEGCRVLFEAFAECVSLSQITLRSNRIGDAGAHHISLHLPQCVNLEELDLSFNKVGNAGAEDFINMFQTAHPSLKELRLNNNMVGSTFKMKLASVAEEIQGDGFRVRV